MRRLKLIWDFRGPVAKETATHHEVHLKEYAAIEKLSQPLTGTEVHSEVHSLAYLVVDELEMPGVRDALKPHRGQVYTEN